MGAIHLPRASMEMVCGRRTLSTGACSFDAEESRLFDNAEYSLNTLRDWTENPGLLDEAKKSLITLKAAFGTLRDLTNSIDTTINSLQTVLLPLEYARAVHLLPDEVLSLIFEFVADRKELLKVSRRFRAVAERTPWLWRMISNQKTNKRVILDCLARSTSRSIEISLEIKNDPSYLDPLEVLDLALPHSERCVKLLLSIKKCSAYSRNILSAIEERLKRASFPRLREFGAHFFDDSSIEDVDPDGFLQFSEPLVFPALQTLTVENVNPYPFVAPNLRSLSMTVVTVDSWAFSFRSVTEAISTLSQLKELSLTMIFRLDSRMDENISLVELPELESLNVEVCCWSTDTGGEAFFEAFDMPKIRKVHIKILQTHEESSQGPNDWLDSLFCDAEYPNLEELAVKFQSGHKYGKYDIRLQKFPKLRTLIFYAPGWHPGYLPFEYDNDEVASRLPAIVDLRLGVVDEEWVYWLEDIKRMLRYRKGTRWNAFEELRAIPGIDVDQKYIENIFKGKRVVWEDPSSSVHLGIF